MTAEANSDNSEKFGLMPEVFAELLDIFKKIPDITKVWLYGSRAKGNYYQGSDIDLLIEGDPSSRGMLSDLHYYSNIPQFIGINYVSKVSSTFYEAIKKDLILIYQK